MFVIVKKEEEKKEKKTAPGLPYCSEISTALNFSVWLKHNYSPETTQHLSPLKIMNSLNTVYTDTVDTVTSPPS